MTHYDILTFMQTSQHEFGKLIAAQRIQQNRQQKALAYEAGVSLRTLQRLERGESVGLDAFIKVLQALGLKESLFELLDASPSPNTLKQNRGKERKRVRQSNSSTANETDWVWPEDQN